ncbi:MAG: hypothetical protein ABFD50_15770, partial [Smithella sp.]
MSSVGHIHPNVPQVFLVSMLRAVSQFTFVSFRSEARNLDFNKFSTLRFLTYVRNDIIPIATQSLRAGTVFSWSSFTLSDTSASGGHENTCSRNR